MNDIKQLDQQIEERRSDPEFQRRLAAAMERNREALALLAKNDEDQPDAGE